MSATQTIALSGIGDAVGNFFSDRLRDAVAGMIQGLTEAVSALGTWFMWIPAPALEGSGGELTPGERVVEYTSFLVAAVGIVATAFTLIAIVRRRDADGVIDGINGLIRVILFSGAGLGGAYILVRLGDELAPWLLRQISGGTFEDGLGQLTGVDAAAASGMGTGVLVLLVVILPFAIIGGLISMVFVLFSFGILPAIAGMLPVASAASLTPKGYHALMKMVGWIIALALFKPAAAIVYGVGIAAVRMIGGGSEDAGDLVVQALFGAVVLIAAGIALPALVRLVVPATATGSGGGGGGNMLMGAMLLATGAVTGGATAVGAVGAGAGAGAGGGAAAAGGGGAAATGASSGLGAAGSAGSAGSGAAAATGGSGGGAAGSGAGSAASTSSGAGSTSPSSSGSPTGGTTPSSSPAPAGGSPNGADQAAPASGTDAPAGDAQAPSGTGRRADRSSGLRAEGAAHMRQQMNDAERAVDQGEEL